MNNNNLKQIIQHLQQDNDQLFREQIELPYQAFLINYIQQHFSSLQQQTTEILEDIFKKFKKQLRHYPLDKIEVNGEITVEPDLIKLTAKECQLSLPTAANREKNFNLSRREFKNLVQQLKSGDNHLFDLIFLAHAKKCIYYLKQNAKVTHEDAYDSTVDALLELRKDLIKGKLTYGNLKFYFTVRAKKKLFKRIGRKKGDENLNIEGMDFEDEEITMKQLLQEEQKKIIVKAIKKLCTNCKRLLEMFYYEQQTLKEIAPIVGTSHVNARKQITRCRGKLRKHLEGYF